MRMNLNASGGDRKQQGRQVRGLGILLEEERREEKKGVLCMKYRWMHHRGQSSHTGYKWKEVNSQGHQKAPCFILYKNTALSLRSDMDLGYESNAPLFGPKKKEIFHIFYLYNCSVSHRIFKTGKDN